MKILIATEPNDAHALSVKLAAENLGHTCTLWFTADMPTLQTNSIYISNECFDWFLANGSTPHQKTMSEHFDIIWWRRPRSPFVPETVHKNDFSCIKKENILFHDSTPLILSSHAWWINPLESVKYADSKAYQLKHAPHFNFKIPPTLISNSPENIKAFLKHHDAVIYKPFFPHSWHENDVLKFSYTQKINLEQLPSDAMLQMTPGIFQQQIIKDYELRVNCFGDHLSAVKIYSQEHPKAAIDWRVPHAQELKMEPYELPPTTATNIRNFMKHLGIVFGCFDFIVTPDNEIYFLEVNQQGQFLWIEDMLPEIRLLDMFVHFMLSRKIDFQWSENPSNIKLGDYDNEVSKLIAIQMSQHVYLNAIKTQPAAV